MKIIPLKGELGRKIVGSFLQVLHEIILINDIPRVEIYSHGLPKFHTLEEDSERVEYDNEPTIFYFITVCLIFPPTYTFPTVAGLKRRRTLKGKRRE